MKLQPALTTLLLLATGITNGLRAETPTEVMERRIGTWITETTSREAAWTPEKTITKGEETIRWTLDKRVMATEGWAQPGDLKSTGMLLYDEQTGQYRSWWFNNKGIFPRYETIGRWDANTETLELRSDLDGNKQTVKLVFTNKDRIDWTMVIKNRDDELMMDVFGHTIRKKEDNTPERSAEVRVLDRFLGTWDVDLTIKVPGEEVATVEGTETRYLSRGGKVVHFENSEDSEFHMLLSHDPEAGNYPGVILAGSFRTLVTGTWDAKSTSMNWKATFPNGAKFTGTYKFIDDRHAESSSSTTSPAGEVLMERTWKQTRRKK